MGRTSLALAVAFIAAPACALYAQTAQEDTTVRTYEMPTVIVVGSPERLTKIAGSAAVVREEELAHSRVFNINEALRKVPGVHVRDEDAFAMRPNVGLRGLNPTRSTKVLLLEDGIPLTYAPYGDNASYYHPPVERFDRSEVLKGSEQLLFGPQTIGGVINYITPAPLQQFGGMLGFTGGNNGYLRGSLRLGGKGTLADAVLKQGDGSRDNESYRTSDMNLKSVFTLGAAGALTLRANYYHEHSAVTYTGITEAELRSFGIRYNPFDNDEFLVSRFGGSATYTRLLAPEVVLTTSLYASRFERDWWRQSSSTTDVQGGTTVRDARLAGLRIDPDSINSIQGRLRKYSSYGIEPRLSARHRLLGIEGELNAGVRAHYEIQSRKQVNGTSPDARSGTEVEKNDRSTDAYSAFVQHRFFLGDWTLIPGLRIEHVISRRTDHLTGASGSRAFTEIIPGFGVTLNRSAGTTLFAGVHRGFAPPRTEDLIITPGGSSVATFTDVDAEKSWNYEIGIRTSPHPALHVEATVFRNDFENLIAVGSVAGGATPLAQAEALFQGLEFSCRLESREPIGDEGRVSLQVVYTYLPTAHMQAPFVRVSDLQPVPGSKAGNRMPYAPEHLVTTGAGYGHPAGWDVQLEMVYTGKQFSDFANTEASTPDGQVGLIAASTVFNAAFNYSIQSWGTTLFLTVKNLTNREFIADRTRGIRPGIPRQVQAGIEYRL